MQFLKRAGSTGVLVVATSLFGMIALAPLTAAAEGERCYGIVKAGQNEGLDGRVAPGTSTVDYQGNAWVMVPAGSCLTTVPPPQPDGTPRRGAAAALARDPG